MIIASKVQPVYAAEQYLGRLDPERGFEPSPNEPLNELRDLRLLETWKDKSPERDKKRILYDIYYLSTLKERVVAYRPFAIQPTVLDNRYHPFDLSYTASSAISLSNPDDWKKIREPYLDDSMKPYLEVPLAAKRLERYRAFLRNRLQGRHGYFDRIAGILEGFSSHRYKMGFQDDTSLEAIDQFLFEKKEGDCTEFSIAAAILARLAGIPSRVVTGYLASRDLQTPAHAGGVKYLRSKIPALQKFPMEELYLVTNAQRHAWVQFYLPEYGWVDFESTAYAIPPEPQFDPNARDVVIPLIDEEPLPPEKKKFDFPYRLFAIFIGILTGLVLFALYAYRFARLAFYALRARTGTDRRSVDAFASLFYIRLAEDGYPIRQFYETPLDYAKQIPETKAFADRLTELRFRESWSEEQRKQSYADLLRLGRSTIRMMRRPGAWNSVKRFFTLRGLLYRP
jgi:transglutaminase-like putative cysteine protease